MMLSEYLSALMACIGRSFIELNITQVLTSLIAIISFLGSSSFPISHIKEIFKHTKLYISVNIMDFVCLGIQRI